jgi:WD40 repeat protein
MPANSRGKREMTDQSAVGQDEVEIAHEALLHHWPRLRDWLSIGRLPRRRIPRLKRTRDPDNGHRSRLRSTAIRRLSLLQDVAPPPARDGATPPAPAASGLDEVEVAHEALIRHWPRLREWLDQDRAALLLRESVREAAQEWAAHQRDESYLIHRGRRLEAAAALQQHPRLDLNALECAYLDTSIALREREEHEREAQRQRELAAERERAELAEQRAQEQAAAARGLRRRLMAAVALGTAAVFAALIAFVGFQQAGEERDYAERQETIARIRALTAEAALQHEIGEDERGALLARQAYLWHREVDAPLLSATDAALRRSLGLPYFSQVLPSQVTSINAAALSADGKSLVVGSLGGAMWLWNLSLPGTDPIELASKRSRGNESELSPQVNSLAFSPDGRWIAVGSDWTDSVQLWDPAGVAAPINLPEAGQRTYSVKFSPDGKLLAACGDDDKVRIWSVDAPTTAPSVIDIGDLGASAIAFDPDGHILAFGDATGGVYMWDLVHPGATPRQLTADGPGPINDLEFSPDGRMLAAAAGDVVRLWDLAKEAAEPTDLRQGEISIYDVAFSPDGQMLAAGVYIQVAGEFVGEVHVWDVFHATADPITLGGHGDAVTAVAYSKDGQILVSAGSDGSVRLWRPNAIDPVVLHGHDNAVWAVAFRPNKSMLASGSLDGTVRLWDFDHVATEPVVLADSGRLIRTVAFSPDGRTMAFGGNDEQLGLWEVGDLTANPIVIPSDGGMIFCAAFAPDGQALVTGSADGAIRIWNVADSTTPPIVLPTSPSGAIVAVAFDRTGQIVATGAADGGVRLWDLASPTAPMLVDRHAEAIMGLAFGGDGRTLVAASYDGEMSLWDASRLPATRISSIETHDRLLSLGISQDGRRFATGSEDGLIRIWDVSDIHAEPVVLSNGGVPVLSISFSSDDRLLASGDDGGVVRLWLASSQALADMVCSAAWRNLTLAEWEQFIGVDLLHMKTCENLPLGKVVQQDALDFAQAVASAIATDNAPFSNQLCWNGSIDGFAEAAMPACERAIELDPENGGYADSRGLARALTGDYSGAVADFSRFVAWAKEHNASNEFIKPREAWIAALQAGQNPFDAETLKDLRSEDFAISPLSGPSASPSRIDGRGDAA